LEAELRTLTAEIEAGEKKMAELPESMEKIWKEATTTMTAGKQLKTKRSTLSKTQEADQRLLENIKKMISNVVGVIDRQPCWRWISVNLEYLLYIGFNYDLQLTRH
jgi:uncharacterized protein YhaN